MSRAIVTAASASAIDVELARHGRDAGGFARASSTAILSPIAAMARASGPMKTMPACLERRGEGGILREEAVAGMHRLGAASLGQASMMRSMRR